MPQIDLGPQLAQRCYHCTRWLLAGQLIVPDPLVKDWVCHAACVEDSIFF